VAWYVSSMKATWMEVFCRRTRPGWGEKTSGNMMSRSLETFQQLGHLIKQFGLWSDVNRNFQRL